MKAFLSLLLLALVSCKITWVSADEFNEVVLRGNSILDIATCVFKSAEVKAVIDDVLDLIRTGEFNFNVLTDALAAYNSVKECITGPEVTTLQEITRTDSCDISCKRIGEERKCTKTCTPRKQKTQKSVEDTA